MATIPPTTMQTPVTGQNQPADLKALYAISPPSMQPANLNPPPTEGLLWPRFDYLIPEN